MLSREKLKIPKELQRALLPSQTLTVNELLDFHLPVQQISTVFTQPDQYLSSDPINCPRFNAADVLVPPSPVIKALSHAILTADKLDKVQSLRCPHMAMCSGTLYPLWLLTFWSELARIRFIKERWEQAVLYLATPNASGLLAKRAEEVCQEIRDLPWDALIEGFEDQCPLFRLHTFCSQDWLTSVHINHMLDLLKYDLELGVNMDASISIQPTYHSQQILDAYIGGDKLYLMSRRYHAIREHAQDLATGVQHRQIGRAHV